MNKIRRYKKLRTVYGIWNGYPFIISNMNEKIVDLSFSVAILISSILNQKSSITVTQHLERKLETESFKPATRFLLE